MKKALGRGLGALFPESLDEWQGGDVTPLPRGKGIFVDIAVDSIVPNRFQPRKHFDQKKMEDLKSSIREKGVVEPILVKRESNDSYSIIAGERRWRAATEVGHKTVPAVVKDVTDREVLEIAIIENIQREDLNPIEEAESYRMLIEEFDLKQEEVGQRVGKERSSITNVLRLLKLPSEIKDHVACGNLSMGHARTLLSLPDAATQLDLCRKVIEVGMSVRELERIVKKFMEAGDSPKKDKKPNAEGVLEVLEIENGLKRLFGTQARLKYKSGKGRIELDFFSDEELERILGLLKIELDQI